MIKNHPSLLEEKGLEENKARETKGWVTSCLYELFYLFFFKIFHRAVDP